MGEKGLFASSRRWMRGCVDAEHPRRFGLSSRFWQFCFQRMRLKLCWICLHGTWSNKQHGLETHGASARTSAVLPNFPCLPCLLLLYPQVLINGRIRMKAWKCRIQIYYQARKSLFFLAQFDCHLLASWHFGIRCIHYFKRDQKTFAKGRKSLEFNWLKMSAYHLLIGQSDLLLQYAACRHCPAWCIVVFNGAPRKATGQWNENLLFQSFKVKVFWSIQLFSLHAVLIPNPLIYDMKR